MKESLHRYLGIASLLLVGSATFAACGGLDPRKVTRGPRFEDGGEPGSNAGSPPVSAGGSNGSAGDVGNPFGGQLFTGGAPPVLEGPPEVLRVDPADMATDVDVDTDVALLFSEVIDAATVTDDSVQLLEEGLPVAGEVELDANSSIVASINPARRLALACTYEVSVSTDVADSSGAALSEAFTSTFTTRDGTWDVVDSGFVADPSQWYMYDNAFMTIDGRGNTLVVWPAADPNTNSQAIWGRWHRATTGWLDPVQLSATGADVGYPPRPGLDANESGDAVVAWREYNATSMQYEIVARRYLNGAWSAAPEPVHGDLAMTSNVYIGPHVKMRGDRVLVWWVYPYVSGQYTYEYIYAQSATPDGAWNTSPQYVAGLSSTESVGNGNLAMDSSGNAMLVYSTYTAGAYALQFAKYVAATDGWEQSAPIESAANVSYDTPAVALDEAGAAMVAWRNAASNYDLTASRYTKARGFATPATLDELDTQPQLSYSNAIATDGTDFFITWMQTVGSTGNAYGSRFVTADGVWSAAQLLSDGDTGMDYPPSTIADPQGNAMSIWLQGNPVYTGTEYDYSAVQWKYARFLASESAWVAPALITGGSAFDRYHGHVSAVSANGIAAVLTYFEGFYDNETMVYTPGEPWLNVFR